MEYKELVKLVRQGEGLKLEFKLKSNHPEKIIREIVAFANTAGGTLLVGVDDTGLIKGLKYPEGDRYVLDKAIRQLCFPPIDFSVENVAVGNEKEILIYHIHHSHYKPHCVIDAEGHKKAYVRIQDKSVQASREMYQIMRRSRTSQNIRFSYGEKERQLMQLLEQKGKVTVAMYAQQANIPISQASKTLVLLVLANVVEIHPNETEDWYTRLELD